MIPSLSVRLALGAALMGGAPLLAGCALTQAEGPTDTLAWARYVSGDDLRAGCTDGAADRVRLILRRDDRRVLAYDIQEMPDGATVRAVEIGTDDRGRLRGEVPEPGTRSQAETRLSPRLYAELMGRLATGGVFGGPGGFGMPRHGRVWLVAGCYDGEHFLGLWPSPRDGSTSRP